VGTGRGEPEPLGRPGRQAPKVDIYYLLDGHGEVLTEHVGQQDLETQKAALSDRDIHDQDLAWLRRADAVVAEYDDPASLDAIVTSFLEECR